MKGFRARFVRTRLMPRGTTGRLLLTGLLFALAIATAIVTTTGAIFTDTESVGGNAFDTGNVDISTSPTSAVVSFTNMAPGDVVTNPLTVSNDGSLQLRYAVTSTTTEDTLAAQLDMTIKTGVTACTNEGFDTDGTVVYGPDDLGSTTGVNVIGDPTQGAQSGDRTLNASASEDLCFQVSLPLSTGNSYESLNTTATFEFNSEQTIHNP